MVGVEDGRQLDQRQRRGREPDGAGQLARRVQHVDAAVGGVAQRLPATARPRRTEAPLERADLGPDQQPRGAVTELDAVMAVVPSGAHGSSTQRFGSASPARTGTPSWSIET